MVEYIERTEELMLAMNAGARAIENTKRYHGAVYTKDVFSESPQEIPYLQAAKVLREVSDASTANGAQVVHWVLTDEKLPPEGRMCFAGTSISATVRSTVCIRHTESGFSSMGTGVGRSQTVEAQRYWRGCRCRNRRRWTEVITVTLTEAANICDFCVYAPCFCGNEPDNCVLYVERHGSKNIKDGDGDD